MVARKGRAWPAFFLGLAFFALGGCATVVEFASTAQAIELHETPFFAQTEHHCGPAALATLLVVDAVATTPDQLAPLIYVPGLEGSLQAELVAATRRFSRVPVRLAPEPQALIAALEAGKPVLVLQNLGLRWIPRWHYAVLVGVDAEADQVILRSGSTRRETVSARAFLRSWDLAQRWALVVAAPDAVPDFVTPENWIAGAAAFESLGRVDLAHTAYRAAASRWPDRTLVWQALANARYLEGDSKGSESALRKAIEIDPGAVAARNNLASLLLQRGCRTAARHEIEQATEVSPSLEAAIAQTRSEIDSATGDDAPGCSR